MAHYAFLDENNVVVEVIVGKDEGEDGIDWEQHYGNFRGLKCKRTSYNTHRGVHVNGGTPFRKNYAAIGIIYNEKLDAFIPPKPFDSWILNQNGGFWEAPLPQPTLTEEQNQMRMFYEWNEELYQSDNSKGWVLKTFSYN